MKKFVYLFKHAETKGKVTGIIALVLAVVAIALVGISAYSTIYGPITEINVLKTFVPEGELQEFNRMTDEMADEVEEAMEDLDQEYLDQFEDKFGMSAEEFMDIVEVVSLSDVVTIMTVVEGDESAAQIFEVIIKVILIYALVLVAFLLLGAFFMRGGFAITSMILSALYFLLFAGAIWLVVYAVVCIAFAITSKIFRTSYKEYKIIEKYKATQEKNPANT